jgi:hypothetical protein
MEVKVKDLSYGLILSNIIPGVFLEMEIFLCIELFTPYKLLTGVLNINQNAVSSITVLLGVIFLGILLGFILDGIHHFLCEDIFNIINNKATRIDERNHETREIFQLMENSEQLQIYRYLDSILYFPYEAYINTFIAMIPGIFLLPCWLNQLKFSWILNIILTLLYIAIAALMYIEAKLTYRQWLDTETDYCDFIQKTKDGKGK